MTLRPRTSISPTDDSRSLWRARRGRRAVLKPSRPTLEALEDRCLPATFIWTNPTNGEWTDARNWDRNQVPTERDDAIIGWPNVVVTFAAPGGGTYQVKNLTCAGTLRVSAGTLVIHDTSTIDDLQMVSGKLSTEDTLTVTGDFSWQGGTLGGLSGSPSLVELRGNTIAGGQSAKVLDQVLVCNYGVFSWELGEIRTLRNGAFSNKPGGTFTARAVPKQFGLGFGIPAAFRPAFENSGNCVIDTKATVEFGSFTNKNELTLNNGKMAVGAFQQTAGVTRLEGGSLSSNNAINFASGQLVGGGTIIGALVNNGARIAPSPVGTTAHTLTVNGSFTQNAGLLALMVGGQSSQGNYDRLMVNGLATLAGGLEVRGTTLPAVSTKDTYGLVTATGGVSGSFKPATTPPVTGGSLVVSYTSTAVRATLTPAVVGPDTVETVKKDPTLINPGTINQGSSSSGGSNANSGSNNLAGQGARFDPGASGLATDLARSLVLNAGLLGLALTGSNRGADATSGGDASANTFSGRLLAASLALLGGEKASSGRNTESSGLSEEFFAALPLNLPELTLPSDNDLLSAEDINRLLMVGGARADILPQAGSQLSVVATLVAGEERTSRSDEQRDNALADLFISPLNMGDASLVAALRPAAPVVAELAKALAEEAAEEEAEAGMRGSRTQLTGALVVLTAFAGVIVGLSQAERTQKRRASEEGFRS